MRRHVLSIGVALCALAAVPATSSAFCGFYVSGAGGKLFNNATQVVMMRQGTRTVLSMQNNYQGPPENFAMVVPVPVVLKKENVKTLPRDVFDKIDTLDSPRLVEYWEQDPCMQPVAADEAAAMPMGGAGAPGLRREAKGKDLGVKIEARFAVGEYQIVILSAKDSTGLDTWLRREKYTIPEGAAPYLEPYVASGSKFFVAKVDIKKVKFEDGQAMLSPLRFYYDSNEFSLPIRLGMINSAGTQDLIVHILAPGQRYQVANYKNVTIPTNLDVAEDAREKFGQFYAALFDRTLEKNPGAVVTEYAWDAGSCDPCPTPPLTPSELITLGADVLGKGGSPGSYYGFVLTRLHARYAKGAVDHDLVFKAAPPIQGGREYPQPGGKLEEGAQASSINNFQARYAIRHAWTGPIACEHPRRGIWGGPPAGTQQQIATGGAKPALGLAFAPRGKVQLAKMVRQDVPEIGVTADHAAAQASSGDAAGGAGDSSGATPAEAPVKRPHKKNGCNMAGDDCAGLGGVALCLALVLGFGSRRRRRS